MDPVIERNGFFAHSENLLLAMLTDERRQMRDLALKRIMSARNTKTTRKNIREFRVPQLNFKAEDYIDLIDWQ